MAGRKQGFEDQWVRPGSATLYATIIFLIIFTVFYASNYDGGFVFDDEPNITKNPAITEFEPGSFSTWTRAAFHSPARLRPIPYLTFAWQWWISGNDPAPFHFVNDLLHAAAAGALFFLILEFLAAHPPDVEPDRGRQRRIAFFGALLWGLHPVQTSTVTYIVQRMAVLSALFSFLGLYLYLLGNRMKSLRAYAGAFLCYLFALFSKENTAAVLPVVFAYEWMLTPREDARREKRMTALAGAALLAVAMALLYAWDSPTHFALGTLPGRDYTLLDRIISAPRAYLRYLGLLVFPVRQALDYGLSPSKSLLEPWTTLPAAVFFLLLLAAL